MEFSIKCNLQISQNAQLCTVKPVLSDHPKKDQKLVFKTGYQVMLVKSIAECSKRAFCNTFNLH